MFKIKKLSDDVILPKYATDGSSGMDVCAYINENNINNLKGKKFHRLYLEQNGKMELTNDRIALEPLGRILIPTGLYVEIHTEYEIQVRPRSGLALKYGITVLNTPGTIDSDYRGEIGIILINLSDIDFIVKNGDKIAQLVIMKIKKIKWRLTERVNITDRNEGGFGSTGL
jgi:dUTP pyrophosphatase